MANSSGERSQVELLADEFLARCKRGERPTIGEYCKRYPELAPEIREVFEALMMVEDLKRLRDGSASGSPRPSADGGLAASLVRGRFEQENLAAADSDESNPLKEPQAETAAFESRPPSSAVLPGQSDISTAHSNR